MYDFCIMLSSIKKLLFIQRCHFYNRDGHIISNILNVSCSIRLLSYLGSVYWGFRIPSSIRIFSAFRFSSSWFIMSSFDLAHVLEKNDRAMRAIFNSCQSSWVALGTDDRSATFRSVSYKNGNIIMIITFVTRS